MLKINFSTFWKQNLGVIYKDNSVTVLVKEATVELDLNEVHNIHVNFKVNGISYTNLVEIADIENKLIKIPFPNDVIVKGQHELELVAVMKNGDVLPTQTFMYQVVQSLENPNAVESETNYPILIELLQDVGQALEETEKAINRIDTTIIEVKADIDNYKEDTTNELNLDLTEYKEATTNELNNKFNSLENATINNIETILDDKIKDIRNILTTRKRVNFIELFTEVTKENIVVTFLSILEMSKSKEILLTQKDNFSPIMIESVSL